ncbi:MAG: hypothetical protein R2710_15795 [Acidimicrobiales bacterium]
MRSGVAVIRFDAVDIEQLQKTALARRLPLNAARDIFRQMIVRRRGVGTVSDRVSTRVASRFRRRGQP